MRKEESLKLVHLKNGYGKVLTDKNKVCKGSKQYNEGFFNVTEETRAVVTGSDSFGCSRLEAAERLGAGHLGTGYLGA